MCTRRSLLPLERLGKRLVTALKNRIRMADIQTRTYIKYVAELISFLGANPETCLSLASELTSKDLITLDTAAKASNESGIQRAFSVMNAVQPVIQGNPDAFRKFIDALNTKNILCSVAAKMEREVDSVRGAGNVPSDSTTASRALTSPSSEPGERNPGSWTCNCKPLCYPHFKIFIHIPCALIGRKCVVGV